MRAYSDRHSPALLRGTTLEPHGTVGCGLRVPDSGLDPFVIPRPIEGYGTLTKKTAPKLKIGIALDELVGAKVDPEVAKAVEDTGRLLAGPLACEICEKSEISPAGLSKSPTTTARTAVVVAGRSERTAGPLGRKSEEFVPKPLCFIIKSSPVGATTPAFTHARPRTALEAGLRAHGAQRDARHPGTNDPAKEARAHGRVYMSMPPMPPIPPPGMPWAWPSSFLFGASATRCLAWSYGNRSGLCRREVGRSLSPASSRATAGTPLCRSGPGTSWAR
jgi:hypothetical protein